MDIEKRIGDAERDAAVQSLREHTSVGRLSLEEFDERMTAALAAKTRGDLARLFADLPGGMPKSGSAGALSRWGGKNPAESAEGGKTLGRRVKLTNDVAIIGAIWVCFFVGVITGALNWWLFFIPMMVSAAIRDSAGSGPTS